MYDIDYYNELSKIDKKQKKEEQETKNRILNMTSPSRKQEEWIKHIGVRPVETLNAEVY